MKNAESFGIHVAAEEELDDAPPTGEEIGKTADGKFYEAVVGVVEGAEEKVDDPIGPLNERALGLRLCSLRNYLFPVQKKLRETTDLGKKNI